jgi:predicted Zn-dependent protease
MCRAEGFPHAPESHAPGTAQAGSGGHARFTRRGFLWMMTGTAVAGCVGEGQTGLGLDLVSADQVQELGLQSWQQIRSETGPSGNATYRRALDQVSSRLLVAAGENPAAWEAVVFEGEEANAFALPGNKIGVYEGLFRVAEDEAQLSAVVGHEIAHNQARHAQQRMSSQAATELGLQALGTALQIGNIGYSQEIAGLLGVGAQYGLILPYSRNQELEADQLGLKIMARAGYDPRAAVALWQNMAQAGGARPPEFASTHPGPEQRIAKLEAMMPEALALYQRG